MAGLDLSGVREVLDDWIEGSRVKIVRDNGVVDDVLNPETGQLEPVQPTDVYEGSAAVLPLAGTGTAPDDFDVADSDLDPATSHRLLLPLTAPDDVRRGDIVEVTAVDDLSGDPALVGDKFEVTRRPTSGTFGIARTAFLKQA